MSTTLLLVGAGNMGFAMLKRWTGADPPLDAHVVEPDDVLRLRAGRAGARAVARAADLPNDLRPDVVVVAVKPQVFASVLPDYAGYSANSAVILSVAAGLSVERIEALLPKGAAVLRCMPNTPASIGQGVMAVYGNGRATVGQLAAARDLLSACGSTFEVDDESLMDAVTAVSGSGPAYLFHFVEALTAAALAVGLPEALAGPMALQTIAGAARLAADGTTSPGDLRRNVTSPGGTTAAALGVLMDRDALTVLVRDAVVAARDRSVALRAS